MVAYEREIESFFLKSAQLIEVFPNARCTTKYRKLSDTQSFITVKTFDAASGAIVKFKTDKTVDLGRLMVGNTKLSSALLGLHPDLTGKAIGASDIEMTEEVNGENQNTVPLVDGKDVAKDGIVAEQGKSTTTASKKKKKKGKK